MDDLTSCEEQMAAAIALKNFPPDDDDEMKGDYDEGNDRKKTKYANVVYSSTNAQQMIKSARKMIEEGIMQNIMSFINPDKVTLQVQREFLYNFKLDVLSTEAFSVPFKHRYEGRLKNEDEIKEYISLSFTYLKVLCERLKILLLYVEMEKEIMDQLLEKQTLSSIFHLLTYKCKAMRKEVRKILFLFYQRHVHLRRDINTILCYQFVDYNHGMRPPTGICDVVDLLAEIIEFDTAEMEGFMTEVYTKVILSLMKNFEKSFHKNFCQLVRLILTRYPIYWNVTIKYTIINWPRFNLSKERFFILFLQFLIVMMPTPTLRSNSRIICKRLEELWRNRSTLNVQRGLSLWKSEVFRRKLKPYIATDFPWLTDFVRNYKSASSPQLQSMKKSVYKLIVGGKGANKSKGDSNLSML